MLRIVLLLTLLATAGWAQVSTSVIHPKVYAYYKTTALSGSAEKITLQQPSSGAKRVLLRSITICQDAAVTWTLSMNGTAASGTAATELLLTDGGAPKATVFHTSDAGAGTTLMVYPLGEECRTLSLENIHLIGDGTTKNVSIASASATANVYVSLVWEERQR